jgi:hypothetical protein
MEEVQKFLPDFTATIPENCTTLHNYRCRKLKSKIIIYYTLFSSGGRNSSTSIATGLPAGRPGFDSGKVTRFLCTIELRLAPGSNQLPIQCVPGAISGVVERERREADNSLPNIAEVKNGGAIPPHPHMSPWHSS